MDASGKVIPGIQLVNDAGERVGNFIAEVENDKFFFSVKTDGGENEAFDAVVSVDVLEHVSDLTKVSAEIASVLRPAGVFLYDTINRNLVSRLATITVAENILGLLPRGTHDPELFIKPKELVRELTNAGLVAGPQTGLGPRGINGKGDFVFGPLPFKSVIYMGRATKPPVCSRHG